MLDVIASATTRAADVVDPRPAAVIEAIAETRRTIARLQAAEMLLLAAAYELGVAQISPSAISGDPDRDLPLRSMAAQIGAATRTPDRTVGARMADAACVRHRYPHTFSALAAGDISAAHLRVIVDAGAHVTDPEALAAYEADAVAVAQRETPGRTRPAVRRLADHHEPRTLTERHRTARECREVTVRDADDGMAILSALLPAPLAHAAYDRLTTIAADVRDAADATDSRTRAQTRADVLADLLLTGHATAHTSNTSIPVSDTIRAHVQVVIPAGTLIGGDLPASLDSGSSVDAATARRLAATATGWDRLFTHPTTGAVLAVDRYRPSDAQKRALAARDSHCRFPGCRVPTRRCDIDHTVARQHDGPTTLTNLAHLCRRHHTLKHHTAWRVTQQPDGELH
ncbi:MAG: HNH endonuclease, partial [Microbacterium sp.]